ncbi:hypothetical protein DHEL01_v208378 [Diaporthe helianthi]|uniref:Luciferase domain-containing protein n=1 Tax=Diaporthe helianthi TaxID=158607 RepID=A0A2P5HSK0_DIAHE|nr:hypothetical protein DHEL01_v208378 [Diaporthe helianthi]
MAESAHSEAALIAAVALAVNLTILFLLRHCVRTTFSIFRWVYDDFYRYLAVGRGGTPSTFSGWCQVKVLDFIARYIFLADVHGVPYLDPMYEPYRGQLFNLPRRLSDRPTIVGLIPQRQANQWGSPETEAAIIALLERKAAENPATLVMEHSYLEGHLRALKRRLPAGAVPGALGTPAEWGGEIAHAHYESSVHVILHPADAAEVVRAGWGERHPLACCAEYWLWRSYYHNWRGARIPLPTNFVLVYAPRDAAEMAVFERIVDAAVWFHTLPGDGDGAKPSNAVSRPPVGPTAGPVSSPAVTAPAPDSR